MFDLVLRGANLPDGQSHVDIGCARGRISAIEHSIGVQGRIEIDARDKLVSPPFVDGHLHMDAALLQANRQANQTGGLYEGIRIWSDAKKDTHLEDYKARARKICHWSIAQGTLHIRCQTDICEPNLTAIRALLEVKEEMAQFITLQIVAFPQDGYFRFSGAVGLLAQAVEMGAEVIGGIPDYELTAELGNKSIRELCTIAVERNRLVDMHIDQTTDPQSRQIESLTAETILQGLGARVTASHCPTLSSINPYYAGKLIDQIAQSQMSIMVQPMQAATCWGIMAPINKLLDAGVNVALGQDCILDPWYPFGKCDMLDIAHMAATFGSVLSSKGKNSLFGSITTSGARALAIEDYGLKVGGPADFVVLDAPTPEEAIRLRPARLAVIRNGNILFQQERQSIKLTLGKQDVVVDPADVLTRTNEI